MASRLHHLSLPPCTTGSNRSFTQTGWSAVIMCEMIVCQVSSKTSWGTLWNCGYNSIHANLLSIGLCLQFLVNTSYSRPYSVFSFFFFFPSRTAWSCCFSLLYLLPLHPFTKLIANKILKPTENAANLDGGKMAGPDPDLEGENVFFSFLFFKKHFSRSNASTGIRVCS